MIATYPAPPSPPTNYRPTEAAPAPSNKETTKAATMTDDPEFEFSYARYTEISIARDAAPDLDSIRRICLSRAEELFFVLECGDVPVALAVEAWKHAVYLGSRACVEAFTSLVEPEKLPVEIPDYKRPPLSESGYLW